MRYSIDPDVLRAIVDSVVDENLTVDESIAALVARLRVRYPRHIDPEPGPWVGSKAGGVLGKVRFLHFGWREYLVVFGTPTGTQGFSGRYGHVDIHKFLIAGRIDSYDLDDDATAPLPPLLPGGHTCLERGRARGLTVAPGSWHLEYGRGAVLTTLPFAMMDTLLLSLEFVSVRRSAGAFIGLMNRTRRNRRTPSIDLVDRSS